MEDVNYFVFCLIYCVGYWELFRTKGTVLNKTPCYVKCTLIMLCVVCDVPSYGM